MHQTIHAALIDDIKRICLEASLEVMRIYHADHGISIKGDDSPLTLADLAAHRIIKSRIGAITPDIPLVSEEDEDMASRLVKCAGTFWLVDPLDGTKEFIARNGEFTVNIALVADGYPVLGVVAAPALGILYWGGAGLGAWRQTAQETCEIHVSKENTSTRVVASKSHLNAETSAFISRLGQVELIQAGSSLKFCRIAEGSADVYPRLAPTCEWDTAAAQAVLEGAGGFVTDLNGQRLRYGKESMFNPHFVASASKLAELGT